MYLVVSRKICPEPTIIWKVGIHSGSGLGIVGRGIVQSGNCPGWELSGLGIVWSGNCPVGELSVGELSVGELSGRGIVSRGIVRSPVLL